MKTEHPTCRKWSMAIVNVVPSFSKVYLMRLSCITGCPVDRMDKEIPVKERP